MLLQYRMGRSRASIQQKLPLSEYTLEFHVIRFGIS